MVEEEEFSSWAEAFWFSWSEKDRERHVLKWLDEALGFLDKWETKGIRPPERHTIRFIKRHIYRCAKDFLGVPIHRELPRKVKKDIDEILSRL
jgi:hypothetical protein